MSSYTLSSNYFGHLNFGGRAMQLQHTVKAVVRQGEQSGYVAECVEIPVVTQGTTLDEVALNLKEAVELHLSDSDPAEWGLVAHPTLVVTFEMEPSFA